MVMDIKKRNSIKAILSLFFINIISISTFNKIKFIPSEDKVAIWFLHHND
jgi:hypothetical protein